MNDWNLLLPLLNDERVNLDKLTPVLCNKESTLGAKLFRLWFWRQAGGHPQIIKTSDSETAHLARNADMKLLYFWLWHKAGRRPGEVHTSDAEISESLGCCVHCVRKMLVDLKRNAELIDFVVPAAAGHNLTIYVYRPLLKKALTT